MPDEKDRNTYTQHLRPSGDSREARPRQTEPLDLKHPATIRFVLDNLSAVLDAPLRNYMVLGRKVNSDDRQVDVDFASMEGQEHGVSRYHAIIQISNDRISIKDFNSSNGTYLNGFILKPMFGYRLRHGDELVLGQLKMTINFMDEPIKKS
ncbi:MAG: FHA domain-containing protein [Aggregatilineales bacterium]